MEFLTQFPLAWIITIFLVLGLIIGSFLNVYLYRFHTGKSLSGRSHCLSCGTTLKPYELIPLISYLTLFGRCRTCSSFIPVRYFLVEILTGLMFVLVALTFTDPVKILLILLFVSVLIVVAVYDFYHMIIPDELVRVLLVVALAFQSYQWWLTADFYQFLFSLVGACAGSLFLYSLWHFSGGKWVGFGDVKLVFPLGLIVGWFGVFSMLVLSFWIGATIGLAIIGLQTLKQRGQRHLRFLPQRLTIKSAVPFAPFLILGCIGVLFFGINVVSLLSYGY